MEHGPSAPFLVAGGLAATAVLTVLVTRKANRTLACHLAAEATETEGGS